MTAQLITKIRVERLFDLYTYEIPRQGTLSNATILYGDNGIGKSTILKLAFHLLSAAGDRGHRSQLYNTSFQRLEVSLASGVVLTAATSRQDPNRVLTLEVRVNGRAAAVWDYQPREHREISEAYIEFSDVSGTVVRRAVPARSRGAGEEGAVLRGEQHYLDALKKHVPSLFILTADRRLDSDAVSDPSDEIELRRQMQYEQPKRINELVVRSREIALSQALSNAGRWLSRQAVRGTNQGSTNVHHVYGQVLRKIASQNTRSGTEPEKAQVTEMLSQLGHIDKKSAELATYELSTHLPAVDFKKALGSKSRKKQELAVELLAPYLASVQSRIDAIEPTYKLVDRFIKIVNSLLSDKVIQFKLSQGFVIVNSLGRLLKPSQLSSGEQQLLLLFSYVLTAREAPTVFMIDEPEISLNVKWQRQLIQSLLDLTEDASIQFMFASHSMELLAQHRQRVVKLENSP